MTKGLAVALGLPRGCNLVQSFLHLQALDLRDHLTFLVEIKPQLH